jgi:hypothetical protein
MTPIIQPIMPKPKSIEYVPDSAEIRIIYNSAEDAKLALGWLAWPAAPYRWNDKDKRLEIVVDVR